MVTSSMPIPVQPSMKMYVCMISKDSVCTLSIFRCVYILLTFVVCVCVCVCAACMYE